METQNTEPPNASAQSLRDVVTDPERCAGDPHMRLNAWRQLMASRGKGINHAQLVKMQRDAGLYGRLAQLQIRSAQ